MGRKLPENVALEKAAQSSFTNAMNTIKALVKKGEAKVNDTKTVAQKKKIDTGVVYLSHIPHGFYETQMENFFSQFGKVTRLKLGRSKKTGKSQGFAFIEFQHKEVAEIVAETMNNYLMFTKLIKAQYIPPEKVTDGIFFGKIITAKNFPKTANRKKNRVASNQVLTGEAAVKKQRKAQGKLRKMQAKLDQLGVDYKIQLGGKAVSLKKSNADSNSENEVKTVEPPHSSKKRRQSEIISESPATPKRHRVSITATPKSQPSLATPNRSMKTKSPLLTPVVKSPDTPIAKRTRKSLAAPVVVSKKPSRKSLPNLKVGKGATPKRQVTTRGSAKSVKP